MKNSSSPDSQRPSPTSAALAVGASLWQRVKSSRISYLTVPLIVMATIVEFVILATGWKYQQTVCLPQGMGVTFFGIGPIGATILAVELLKLPLAMWTASRVGWQKGFMLIAGLPLICILTFQLVKDMAVYEMGTAMKPASELLEKAAIEETKIVQLNGDLAAIEAKKTERETKLAEFAAKKTKAKTDLEESLKRNEDLRKDAISLTDYQKKELSEVEIRQAAIARQFDNDAAQLTKAIADLRARREAEVASAGKWNAEDARIENAYKKKLSEYTNKKNAYEKAKAEYEGANILKRQLMSEPVDPGVPPERETNTILKPTAIADLDAQIKSKETELAEVNNRRRERVAQVGEDARRLRDDFDKRSTTKRDEADRKREELLAAQATLLAQLAAEEKQLDAALAASVQKVDGIRAEIDDARKRAEGHYEAREAVIRGTQVHRIATTVEIVRGLFFGERPLSINATAKERGDILTDQISMVRIWVYPVLAFIVAFLPTLMVEIGFSTLFKSEQPRPQHRLGFFGRRMHELYTRAGRQKILRAERLASEAAGEIALREKALTTTKASLEKALADAKAQTEKELAAAKSAAQQALAAKDVELQAALDASSDAAEQHAAELKDKEASWLAKFTGMADSLNRAISENEALRDFQKSEIERQVQVRQNAWSDRFAQLRQELDEQRAAAETERTTMLQEHQRRLLEVTEESKNQVIQARRQMAESELAAVEKVTRLNHELKEARAARDTAEFQLKHQSDAVTAQLAQAQEDLARELEKAARQEKQRLDRQQLDFEKTLRQREDAFENRWKQREQELSLAVEAQLAQEKARGEQEGRVREAELALAEEGRLREIEAHWSRELKQREEAAQARLKQREQQLQAQAETRLRELQAQADEQLRRKELDVERQREAQGREAASRLREGMQAQELSFHTKLKQREQELVNKAAERELELQTQFAADLRGRQAEWEQQAESRQRALETRLAQETQQKEEAFQLRLRQREQQLLVQFNTREAELQARWDDDAHRREAQLAEAKQREQTLTAKQATEREAQSREAETRLREALQAQELAFHTKLKQREQELFNKAAERELELQSLFSADLRGRQTEWEQQAESRLRALETRLAQETQQKEEAFQLRLRQREQQLLAQLNTREAELQARWDDDAHRREAQLAEAKQREQTLNAKLAAEREAHQEAQMNLEMELEVARSTIEPLRALLAQAEKACDEERQSASEGIRHVQDLRKKLMEASSALSNGRNGRGQPTTRA